MRSISDSELVKLVSDACRGLKGKSGTCYLRLDEDLSYFGNVLVSGQVELFFPADGSGGRSSKYCIAFLGDGVIVTIRAKTGGKGHTVRIKRASGNGSAPRSSTGSTGRLVGSMV